MLLIVYPDQDVTTEFEFDYYVAPPPYTVKRNENIKIEKTGTIWNFQIEKINSNETILENSIEINF